MGTACGPAAPAPRPFLWVVSPKGQSSPASGFTLSNGCCRFMFTSRQVGGEGVSEEGGSFVSLGFTKSLTFSGSSHLPCSHAPRPAPAAHPHAELPARMAEKGVQLEARETQQIPSSEVEPSRSSCGAGTVGCFCQLG